MPNGKWLGFGFARSNLILAAMLAVTATALLGLIHSASLAQPEPIVLINGPLVISPPVMASDKAKLPDDCQIIGITHNGKSRAYLVTAFLGSHQHVVNDLVGGKPFAICYCDRNNCTRVLTRNDSTLPLNVTVGGWVGTEVFGTLMLRVGSSLFRQDTLQAISKDEAFPYLIAEFERTTWKEWRTKHPDSDVYTKFPK